MKVAMSATPLIVSMGLGLTRTWRGFVIVSANDAAC